MNIKKIIGIGLFLAGFCVLCGLGIWQYQRAQWKDGIILRLEQEYARDAATIPLEGQELLHDASSQEWAVASGYVDGAFIQGALSYWPRVHDAAYGFEVLQGFRTDAGTHLLVNRGWVPEDPLTHRPLATISDVPEGRIRVMGLARTPDNPPYALGNEPEKNLWYTYDRGQLEAALKLDRLAAAVLYVRLPEGAGVPDYYGALREREWYPRNKHREYMLFWFSLAALWAGMFGYAFMKKGA